VFVAVDSLDPSFEIKIMKSAFRNKEMEVEDWDQGNGVSKDKSGDDGADEAPDGSESYRNVGIFSLLVVAFFWASGGIYGNEVCGITISLCSLIQALLTCAPPAYAFLGLLITPIIYSVPIALMTAELATALPRDGGLAAWVTEACGTTIGGHNTYWQWIAYIFDASVYPVLAGQYVAAEVYFVCNCEANESS
jgi:hypothetical protein